MSKMGSKKGTLQDEVAAFSMGDPLKYSAFLDMTRLEMYRIAMGRI